VPRAAHSKQGAKSHRAEQDLPRGSAGCKLHTMQGRAGAGVMGMLQSIVCEGRSAPGPRQERQSLRAAGAGDFLLFRNFLVDPLLVRK